MSRFHAISIISYLLLGYATLANAQSTTRNEAPIAASGSKDLPPTALQGYCPVCLIEMKKWVKGEPSMAVDFDGRRYLFPGREQALMFQASPEKYVPILDGDDLVEFARTGKRVAGDQRLGALHGGRIYMFATAENKRAFQDDPKAFADSDLALGGECIVCRVGMNERVKGSADFTAVHKGLRYLFPAEEQKRMFVASPDQFVKAISTPGSGAKQSGASNRPSGNAAPAPAGSRTR